MPMRSAGVAQKRTAAMGSEEADAAAPAAHDLCFVVDGTGSMQYFLAALAQSLPQVMLDPANTHGVP